MWNVRTCENVLYIEHADCRYPLLELPAEQEADAYALASSLNVTRCIPTVVIKRACSALKREVGT